MKQASNRRTAALTLIDVVVSVAVLAFVTVAMTHAMLVMNRNASTARVKNLAKAIVLGRIQEVSAIRYDPSATPAVVPSILNVKTTTETIAIPIAEAGLPSISATLTWKVENADAAKSIRSITCRLDYTYLGKAQNYEVVTFRSPD